VARGEREGVGGMRGVEMAQPMYAHMNKETKKKKEKHRDFARLS
jgi:hypothetical protein